MMDQEKFLQELEEIKTGYNVGSREFSSRSDGSSVCNRLYNALLECLAVEADHVEAKLRVLTLTLCFYVDLRIRQDAISPEADAFGHFLFMECSRLVLGLQFHHLENTDPYKASFKNAISDVYTRLQEFAIGQVFVVLEWLMVNQWSHPTLVAMMKGEEIEKERALNFIRSGEYPELFRLRVEMLMQSGCDNFASNLVSWCIQSPLFESDVPLRSTHLLLLQKLGKFTQLQNQCYQMNCCLAREVIKYMEDRLMEDASFLLSLSYNFLFIDWVKPANFCCTKSLLESWLKIQRQKESDMEKFMDSVSKVVGLAQNVRQLNIMLDAMVNLFDTQFIQFCSEVAINSIEKHRQLQQMNDGFESSSSSLSSPLSSDASSGLVQICRIVAKLYQNHPQIHLSCLTSALCLEPTEESYRCLETAFRTCPPSLCSYDVTNTFPAILDVNPNTFSLLLESVDSLRPPNLHPQLGWDVLVKTLLPNFEPGLDDGSLLSGVMDATEADGVNRFNFCDDGLGSKEVEMEGVSCMLDQESLGYPPDGMVSPSLTNQVLNDDTLTGDQDIDGSVSDGVLFQRHCHQELLSSDDAYRYHDGNLMSQDGDSKNILNNITLDDIQQVLSGSTLGSSGKEAPMDERALQEITAFLQSEMGKNSSALGFDTNQSQMNEFLDSSYNPNPKCASPPPYYSISRSHHYGQSNDRSQNCSSSSSAANNFSDRVPSPNLPNFEEPANPPISGSKNHVGANILVTDSNFPYLKQFLPHLQTVMQSVQSLVRCSSGSNNNISACANSTSMSMGSHQVVHSSSTCSSLSSSSVTFPSSIASNDTQDVPSPSSSPQFQSKDVLPNCSSPSESAIPLKQPQSMQTSSTRSSIDGSPHTIPSPFEDAASKPLLKCDFCSKEFMSKAGRTTHILRVHGRNRKLPHPTLPHQSEMVANPKFVTSPFNTGDHGASELACPTHSEASQQQRACDSPADPSASNLKHCFVKIVRLDKDSQSQDQQNYNETDASPLQTGLLKHNNNSSGKVLERSLSIENQKLLQQIPENMSPPCMCESCGGMFSSQEQLNDHNCDCGALINTPNLTPASVHSTTNPLQNIDIFDNRSNQMCEESTEPGANKVSIANLSSGNQKIVFLVNSNLQHNNLSNVLQSNQSKMQAFLRTLKISNTNNQSSQNCMAPNTSASPPSSSPGAPLASPRNIPTTSTLSPQSSQQIVLHQRQQLQDHKPINANSDKQPPFIEMLKLADHFLKNNNLKVAQHATCQALPGANPQNSVKTTETLHLFSIPHNNNNNALQQMNLLSTNQKLLHVINKTNLTIPQLKIALQGNIILNNNNNSTIQGSSLQGQHFKLELPGKEVLLDGIKMIEQVEFLCESCLLTFPELDAASQHVNSSDHLTSNVARYSIYCCPFCGVKYRDKLTVKNHIIFTCPNSIKPLSDIFALNKFHNVINTNTIGTNNSLSENLIQGLEGQVAVVAETEVKSSEVKSSSDRVIKQEFSPSSTCAKSLSLHELMNSPITMVSLLKQPSQVQPLQQLQKCHFCFKMFSSAEYLNLHVSTKHQVARYSEPDVQQSQESTSAMIKNLILKSNMVVTSNGNEVKNVVPTPSAVSVPTLEQLTLGFKHSSGEGAAQKASSPFVTARPDLSSENKTLQSPLEAADGQTTPVTPKQGVINIPVIGNQKNLTSISNIQNVTQIPSLVPHPPKTSKAKGILYKNVYMQCEGTYYCSVCKADLSSRESKRNHRQLACGDPKTVTYSRKYFYLCPYCYEKFPSQKECRHHQVTECLPMIGVSTDELTVKELACPLCPKKYHNLIPLKGHMTQVHHLPKSETRKMLEGLGYLETAFDQHILANASAVSSSSFGIFSKAARGVRSSTEEVTNGPQMSQPMSQQTQMSGNINLASSCSSMDIFDLDPDMSSDVNSEMPCDVAYHKESSVMFSPVDSDDRSKKDSCFDDYDINSTLLNIDSGATPNSCLNDSENSRKLQTPTLLSHTSFDESPSSWSSPSPNVSSSLQLPSSSRSDDQQPLSCSSFTADSTLSPEQKRRRNTNSTKPAEFFTMMFRNYPILAKGVYICSACQSQMTCSAEADRHAAECPAQKNGKPIEIKRSTLFKCTHCTATFWKAKLCRQHQIENCLSEASTTGESVDLESLTMPSVACPLCSVRSYNRSGLMSHMKYKHGMDTKGVREIMEKCGIRKQTPERFGAPASVTGLSCSMTSESTTLATTISTIPDVFSMSVAASSVVSSDGPHVVATNSIITSSFEGSFHADNEESGLDMLDDNASNCNEPPSRVKSHSVAPGLLTKQNSESKRKFGSIIGSVVRNSKKEKLTISLKSNKRPADDVRSHVAFNPSPGMSDSSSDDIQKPPMAKKKPARPEELSSATVAQSMVC